MSERNQRQFSLMRRQIVDFEAGHLSLGNLIGDLEFLHAALDQHDHRWDRSYLDQLGTLEECYGVMLDEDRTALSEQESKLVYEAINILKDLLSVKSTI